MSENAMENHVREKIIADPNVLLEDADIMRALVAANAESRGGNVIDLRGIAMERLEARLDRLEDTHRNVIAAAYDNLASTNQVQRAILRMMDATEFDVFLNDLSSDVANILRVDAIRLVLETEHATGDVEQGTGVLSVPAGFIDAYINEGRQNGTRQVTLRPHNPNANSIYSPAAEGIRSEACLRLDLGEGCLPGMLVIGSNDPEQFSSLQGTDLLSFFTGVFERVMRRWLD